MDYVKLAATVTRLINKNGRSTVLQKMESEPADPDKPWKGAGTPTVATEVSAKGVFVPPTGDALGGEFISTELLSRASEVLLVGPNVTDLTEFNAVVDNAVRWRIEWCYTLRPADSILLYAFGVKR